MNEVEEQDAVYQNLDSPSVLPPTSNAAWLVMHPAIILFESPL